MLSLLCHCFFFPIGVPSKQALQRGQSSSRAREALRLGALDARVSFLGGGNAFFLKKITPIFWGNDPNLTNMSFKWVGKYQQLDLGD